MRTVLIADPNTPFATVVGEALREMGAYSVTYATSGPEAEQICAKLKPDLAVVDVDLPDCDPAALVETLRAHVPELPVVLIPYSEAEVPDGLDIQGILTKPFFLPDLPALINSILGAPPPPQAAKAVPVEAAQPPAEEIPAKTPVIDQSNRSLVEGHVEALSHAMRDEPVLLTQGARLITISPRLSRSASAALVDVVVKAWQGANPSAEVVRFEGSSDTTRYMLYSVSVAHQLVLSVALRVRFPLPTVRRLARDTADELASIVLK